MELTAENLRAIKEFISTRIASIANIGVVLPSRYSFKNPAGYFSAVAALGSQKAMDKSNIAFCMVFLANPRSPSPENRRRIFELTYALRAFRKGFETRVNPADVFQKKIFDAEDKFDAVCVNIGQKFAEDITSAVTGENFRANIRPIVSDQFIRVGTPEYIKGVEGFYEDFYLKVEIINVC